jgi:ribosomal protein S18 acetylase RimI-like enzyme
MRKPTAELVVRPRRASDDAFLYRLSERVFSPWSRSPAGSLASMLAERGSVACVAEQAGVPVGFFVLGFERLERSFGPWQRPAVARLNAIGVEPDHHCRGFGASLLESAQARARAQGAVSMTLMTAETNARAQRLFTRAGFRRMLEVPQAYTRGQRGVLMVKALSAR